MLFLNMYCSSSSIKLLEFSLSEVCSNGYSYNLWQKFVLVSVKLVIQNIFIIEKQYNLFYS